MLDHTFEIASGYRTKRICLRVLYAVLLVSLAVFVQSWSVRCLTLVGALYYAVQAVGWLRTGAERIELQLQGIRLPPLVTGLKSILLKYDDIEYISYTQGKGEGRWMLSTKGRVFAIHSRSLAGEDDIVRLQRAFLERRQSSEEGREWLGKLEINRLHLRAFRHLSTRSTKALIIFMALGYVAELVVGAVKPYTLLGGDPFILLTLGAYSGAFSGPEHWYRLVATLCLHAGLVHLYFNGVALWAVGGIVERLLGPSRYLIIFLVSGTVSAYLSGLSRDGEALVGASAGICGLIGSFWLLHLFRQSPIPRALRQPARSWLVFLLLNSALLLVFPQIDWFAHLMGFLIGVVLTAVFIRRKMRLSVEGYGTKFVAMLAAGAALACLVQAVQMARTYEPTAMKRLMLTAGDKVSPDMVNMIAWDYVVADDTTRSQLTEALVACVKAIDRVPSNFHLRDTIASLHFRLGNLTEAKSEALKAFADAHKGHLAGDPLAIFGAESDVRRIYASQVLRVFGRDREKVSAQVSVMPNGNLDIDALTAYGGRQTFFVVHQGENDLGVIWLYLPKELSVGGATSLVDYPPPPGQLSMLVSLPWTDSSAGFGYWAIDEEVLAMPGPKSDL